MKQSLQRVAAGFGANAFAQATNTAIQLLSLPLFLGKWSAATYGTWLILTALPSYFYLADGGMLTAAANRMTMATARSDVIEANAAFQSAIVFVCIVCLLVAAVAVPLVLWLPLASLDSHDHRIALVALIFAVLLQLCAGLADAQFKATGRYAKGIWLNALGVQLGGWAGSMVGLYTIGSYSAVAIGSFLAQFVALGVLIAVATRGTHGMTWGWRYASWAEVRMLLKPALSFMAFPLSNALTLQGLTLLVGHLFGAVAVAVFNTSRTLARILVQVNSLLSYALWPEFSRLYGKGNTEALSRAYRHSALAGCAPPIILSLVLYFAAPWLVRVWTHGAIVIDDTLMLALLVYAAVGGLWHIPRILLMATNQHIELAQWSVLIAVLMLGVAYALAHLMGLPGVGFAMLLSEATLAAICVHLAGRALARARPQLKRAVS